ncbi:MAG: 50S ribosomal protein L18Ae [Candidatus Micrarchaeota archaeon]|nr:50S ribosomal protein L18Ae [Candidatus Micrarchaeota archaeon]
MAKFIVSGVAKGRQFEKEVEAPSEKLAREYAYSLLGSNAGIKRSAIKITSVKRG